MVLESLIDAVQAERKPGEMVFIGFIYAIVGTLLSIWVFKQYSSLISVFLITMASIPLVYSTIKYEEEKDLQDVDEKFLIKEHGKALRVFIYLFIGITLGYFLIYLLLPSSSINYAFKAQAETITNINARAIDNSINGYFVSGINIFFKILTNNFRVLMFCVLFSFLYGLGAIFIMTWNASVIATAMGNFARSELARIALNHGSVSIAHYLQVIPLAVLRYSVHGLIEVLAYFTAGLAGGIISVAVIRHDFYSRKFEHIIMDSSDLLILSIILLIIAAFVEVYVTPLLF